MATAPDLDGHAHAGDGWLRIDPTNPRLAGRRGELAAKQRQADVLGTGGELHWLAACPRAAGRVVQFEAGDA